MTGKTILHYKFIKELGRGGMGIVYLAEDTRLKRKVAIKILPQRIAAESEARERFRVEAQAAAALNHPNITQIYAIEEADDTYGGREMFIVMEYIEGQELNEMIGKIPPIKSGEKLKDQLSPLQKGIRMKLSLPDVIAIAAQVAEGLKAAHEKGIIHRDIKSSNIMITPEGRVKIMDFGLAKMVHGVQLTQGHSTLGTTAYMSPEQTRGDEVDHRTDIWSFGVVLYEMLTQKLPFRGEYEQAVIYAILNDEPADMHLLRSELSGDLVSILDRTLEKNVNKRFQYINEVIKALALLKRNESSDPITSEPKQKSIAVLPFSDMSPARDQNYFCEGISEEILNSLSKINALQVSSRTSSFQFKDKSMDIREIGKKLNVQSILEGSVRKAGERLRVNVQLINVSNGFQLWSDRYDRSLEDVFSVQDEIAENVVTALKGILTPSEKEKIRSTETAIEAYEYFLKGRYLLNQFSMDESQAMFENAVKMDAEYAPAYAGLADVYSWRFEWFGANPSDLEAADRNSIKALELAPQLAESHTSRGYVLNLKNQYEIAEKEFQKAIRLNPNAFNAYYYYARSCFAKGDIEKSVEFFSKAAEVAREDFQSTSLLAQSLAVLDRREHSAEANRETLRRIDRQLELDPFNRRALSLGALALFHDGQQEKSLEWLDRVLNLYSNDTSILLNGACLFALAGKKEEALDLLERVFGKGYGKKDWIEHDPDYDSLRDEPRFQELIKKLH